MDEMYFVFKIKTFVYEKFIFVESEVNYIALIKYRYGIIYAWGKSM